MNDKPKKHTQDAFWLRKKKHKLFITFYVAVIKCICFETAL